MMKKTVISIWTTANEKDKKKCTMMQTRRRRTNQKKNRGRERGQENKSGMRTRMKENEKENNGVIEINDKKRKETRIRTGTRTKKTKKYN